MEFTQLRSKVAANSNKVQYTVQIECGNILNALGDDIDKSSQV